MFPEKLRVSTARGLEGVYDISTERERETKERKKERERETQSLHKKKKDNNKKTKTTKKKKKRMREMETEREGDRERESGRGRGSGKGTRKVSGQGFQIWPLSKNSSGPRAVGYPLLQHHCEWVQHRYRILGMRLYGPKLACPHIINSSHP